MAIAESILPEFDHETATTRTLLERVPADKAEWKPHAKSMSLGQLAMHVATTPGGVSEVVRKSPFDASNFAQPNTTNAAELLPALDQGIAKAKENLRAIGDAGLGNMWRVVQGDRELMTMPVGAAVRSIMLNHWYHHRGQLSVYLRELNVPVPSIYGPSADENPFAETQTAAAVSA